MRALSCCLMIDSWRRRRKTCGDRSHRHLTSPTSRTSKTITAKEQSVRIMFNFETRIKQSPIWNSRRQRMPKGSHRRQRATAETHKNLVEQLLRNPRAQAALSGLTFFLAFLISGLKWVVSLNAFDQILVGIATGFLSVTTLYFFCSAGFVGWWTKPRRNWSFASFIWWGSIRRIGTVYGFQTESVTANPNSDLESRQRRAERFGVSVQMSEEDKRRGRAARYSLF